MNEMKRYVVFIDGERSEIEEKDFEKYNVLVNKSNGYSHTYIAIEKFDKTKHFTKKYCHIFQREFSYVPTHLTVKNIDGFVIGTSTVSFT